MGTMAKRNMTLSTRRLLKCRTMVEVTTGEEMKKWCTVSVQSCSGTTSRPNSGKERGVGDLKILKHRSKRKSMSEETRPYNLSAFYGFFLCQPRFRIVLRREQVHKIACNHYLTKDMKLTPMRNSDNAVAWFAMDYAEEDAAEGTVLRQVQKRGTAESVQ